MKRLGKLAITLDIPSPQVVVEVVSPGLENHRRDYEDKPRQYAARGISEHWIVDPEAAQIMILTLDKSGQYQTSGVYQGDRAIVSPSFPKLNLSAEAILKARA